MKPLRRCLALLCMLVLHTAEAHIASNSFLNLTVEGRTLSGSIELAMRDGEMAVGLDSNGDGQLTWGELRAHQPELDAYLQARLSIGTATLPCKLVTDALQINERVDGNYLWVPFTALCSEQPDKIHINYRLLDDVDPSHRGLLTLVAWGTTQTAVLGGKQTLQQFAIGQPTRGHAFAEYLTTGVWHIWSGIDHLLFLLSLLLPAVLWRAGKQWQPVTLARPAFINIIKVVSAFTVAHSITLSLAAFNVVRLPSRITEAVIAASIIVAALNNVFPKVTEGRWRIAFLFGLLHGFGFASVLADMGLPDGARLLSLVAFNLGVELGQLAVVMAVMPLAYLLRATRFYRRGVMPWGSSAIALLALVWMVQRATA
jgi:HupE / UreJ protein